MLNCLRLRQFSFLRLTTITERADGALPFWRTRPSAPARTASGGGEPTKVIGASYSHADALLESLSISGAPGPITSPKGSLRSSESRTPPPKLRSTLAQPSRHNFSRFGTSWSAGRFEDQTNDDEYDESDDEEDEFGLPNIVKPRKKHGKPAALKLGSSLDSGDASSGPWKIDSGDIAEERGLPNYPSAKFVEDKILRPQYKEIIRDPANALHLISHPPRSPYATSKEAEAHASRITRINKFKRLLQASTISLVELRALAWSGIPEEVRPMVWQMLLGYLPANGERRVATLEKKRKEYLSGVQQAFEKGTIDSNTSDAVASGGFGHRARGRGLDEVVWHQISIDVPRTNPHIPLYAFEATRRSLERILYLWAIRHPASGYVQGINDLATPFWQVFLASYITGGDIESGMDPGQLPKQVLDAVEADTFWCLTKLLDGIQDNYVHAQPGIVRQVSALRDLTKRIDVNLVNHMEEESVEFMQFSFRWMNCLLMREISVKSTIRMWDTYLAEEQGFSEFHLYVCAAFLVKWSEQLMKMDFQETMMFLQALPTRDWTTQDIELLLSEAYIWKSLFSQSSAHLKNMGSSPGHFG